MGEERSILPKFTEVEPSLGFFSQFLPKVKKIKGPFINYVRQKGGGGGVKKSLSFLTRGRGVSGAYLT